MFKHSFKILLLTLVTLLLAGIFLTGCAKTQAVKPTDSTPASKIEGSAPAQPVTANPTPTPSQPTPHSIKLTLYFPNSDATGLVATDRTVTLNDEEIIKAMFKELTTPPSGLEKPLPQGTTLLSASVSTDGVATISLSKEFQKNFKGGSAGEQMTIYSIVNTLTTLSNVHSVQFLLEGKKLDGILGNLATDTPLTRNE
ncbi:MAG: GerMN domain-containing protein, partial [Bacillota bacterium]|nr:GerMN domain-containing protein [Bacillota bacterium]